MFVMPSLEFSSSIWCSYTTTDINRIKSVQRSFKKAIKNLRFSTYKECLVNICIDSLQCRRVKDNLVFYCSLMHGFIDSSNSDLLTIVANSVEFISIV
jgi:hypothetical protein